ncbi:CpaD family pilus assembly lipoprotein [Salinisphaera sp.]|uniref:CpaD family pilus assembly lipoprotein n=1 Tax=Salinisphaera sp. TaxID=1914330 RepID=UPI002D777C72|nr:CpaD family pilus assembly lipoprotein [Salinisphaera sp.]HET7314020.1 CpaD family pilus assembly lipoprotein [Salinisphaera sp.]
MAVVAAVLCGCVAPDYGEDSWRGGYQVVSLANGTEGQDTAGASSAMAVAPSRCMQKAPDDSSLLPPGCANDLNLARMVARPSDLIRGRTPGPARAAPVARAARAAIAQSQQRAKRRHKRLWRDSRTEILGYALPSSE